MTVVMKCLLVKRCKSVSKKESVYKREEIFITSKLWYKFDGGICNGCSKMVNAQRHECRYI